MYVNEYMHRDVITTTSETPLPDAEQLMLEKGIRRLPVVDDGKLVGLLTRGMIRETAGHYATSMTRQDLNDKMDTMKVKDLMETQLCTVPPSATVEWAVTKAQMWNVATILVVEGDDTPRLVGILTNTDLYRLLSEVLGFGEAGVRLHVFDLARTGSCQEVLGTIIQEGIRIKNMYRLRPPALEKEDCILHLDTEDASRIVDTLTQKGYQVEIREC
ncbi:MAG: CBS domain-containing protein [Dehalococcoidia bacterium]